MIDAKEKELEFIVETIKKYVTNCEIRVFGSRIKGAAKPYSDIDVAIVSDRKIEPLILEKIRDEFAESDLPYRVDVLDFNAISESFRKIIEAQYEVIQKAACGDWV